jgi:O-antigen/teichoic acid export membrane protein
VNSDSVESSPRARVVRGIGWAGLEVVTLQVFRFLVALVLVRLLTPHEYGLASMAMAFSPIAFLLSDAMLSAALVQRAQITEEDRSTVFWASVAIGGVLSVVGVALSGVVADFFGEPRVQPLFAVLSLSYIIMALGRTHGALMQRDMDFRGIVLRVMAASVLGSGAAVLLAVFGFGPWALIGQQITITVASTAILWSFSSWYPRFTFSLRSLRELGPFGSRYFGSRLAEHLTTSADKVVVGRMLGSSALGAYGVAYNLVLVPVGSMLTAVLGPLFPGFSRLQHEPDRLARGWLRGNRLLASVAFPSLAALALISPELVPVLLGERWVGAIPLVQILALAGLVQSVSTVGTTVLAAVDRTQTLLRFSVVELTAVLVAVVLGAQSGVVGAAAGYAVAILCSRLLLTWLATRAVGVPVRSFFSALHAPAEATAGMTLAIAVMREALLALGTPAAFTAVLLVAAGLAVYVALVVWRAPDLLREFRAMFRSKRPIPSGQPVQAAGSD